MFLFKVTSTFARKLSPSFQIQTMGKKKTIPIPAKDQASKSENEGPITMNKNGHVLIKVLAKPGANCSEVIDILDEGVKVSINAPPVDGEANAALVKYLAKTLGLKKSDVSLHSGHKSKNKVISALGISVEFALQKLKQESQN